MRYRPPERKEKVPLDVKAFAKRWVLRFLIVVGLIVGLIFLLRAISYAKGLSITEVVVSGTIYADSQKIERSIEKYLEKPVLGIFSRRNIFLISRYRLEEYVKAENKGLKGAVVDIKDKVINIKISEYKPDYLWCGDTPPLVWDEVLSCFYVSEDGFIFSKSPFFSGNAYFKFYGPLGEGFSIIPIGSRISDLTQFFALVEFRDAIKKLGLKPESIAISGLDTITMQLSRGENRDQNEATPKIIFNKNQNFRTLARHLEAAIAQEELKNSLADRYNKLLYIDLRYDSKVFYKFLK